MGLTLYRLTAGAPFKWKIAFHITSDVVDQGIVLASILAGFGLTVSAQVAFASKQTSLDQTIGNAFVSASFCSLIATSFGMASMGTEDVTVADGLFLSVFLITLLMALLLFIWGLHQISRLIAPDHPSRYIRILGIFSLVFILSATLVIVMWSLNHLIRDSDVPRLNVRQALHAHSVHAAT